MKTNQRKKVDFRHPASMLVFCILLISQTAIAHNKVVVIPLGGEDAISHPVAKTFINSIGMQFNELPAGSFTMGSPSGVCPFICQTAEPGRDSDEDQHTVTLSMAFSMQTTEVTNGAWDAVISDPLALANPSATHSGANYPVENISWYDAVFFANRLSIVEGRSTCYTFSGSSGNPGSTLTITTVTMNVNCTGYRLPTEAEWEYAARAGTTKAYANPIGFDNSDIETGSGFNGNLHAMGWYLHNNFAMGYNGGTKPVARKQANVWGLYDMHGNVWEWNWDRFGDYPAGAVTDPLGHASNVNRVFRSGSWGAGAGFSRSASRLNNSPGDRNADLGFRLVLPQGQ